MTFVYLLILKFSKQFTEKSRLENSAFEIQNFGETKDTAYK